MTKTESTTDDVNRILFNALVDDARTAATAYYDTGDMVMPDREYDALVDLIAGIVAVHPDWDDRGVTSAVAAGVSAGGDVTHPSPMLSLTKAKTLDEVADFVSTLGDDAVVVEVKLDGLAVRATYVDGRLIQAATRGDGTTGENITHQVTRDGGISGLPNTLNTAWTGEVRGEIFMTNDNFDTANANRVNSGKPAFVNPRNATAGSIRNLDRTYATPMSFAAYDISGPSIDEVPSYTIRMEIANSVLGFTTALTLTPTTDHANVSAIITGIGDARDTLGYPIDGAVIKADSNTTRERLGYATRSPHWATSYKYAADTATSILRDVLVAVGRTGRISYTAVIDPTYVGGATVSRASLHNGPWLRDQKIGIGSTVAVYRAGDVIPRVTALLGDQPSTVTPYVPADTCPQCGETLDKTSQLWRCHTPTCSIVGALAYFASRDAMDIDRVGESVCEALVEHRNVTSIADVYDLTLTDFSTLPMGVTTTGGTRVLGIANATEILNGLRLSKDQPFNRVVTSLGLRSTGRSVGRWVSSRFKNMDALRAASVDDIAEIDKMGSIKAQHIVDGLARMGDIIDRLTAHGLTMSVVETGGDKPLAGKTYVISGSVPGYTRTTISERIEALGGTASSSVSTKTTALVTSETDTSKAKKAASLGVTVLDPAVFAAMLT